MINFISELEADRKKESEIKQIKESTDYKIRVLNEKKEEAKDLCLDTLFCNLYKDAVPMDDAEKNMPYNDLDEEFLQFMKAKQPKGTSYYVKEAIKKGSKPCKALMEAVDSLLHDIFLEYEMNIDEISADDIKFDPEEPEVSDKLAEISANMEFDELSEAIKNNVKVAANDEINRVREEREKIKELEDSLKEDETVTSESAIDREMELRGLKNPNPAFYQPTLFEGVMINKLNLIKESGCDLSEEGKQKLAFVESVKEMTKLSILQSFMMESFNTENKRKLAKDYAMMKESGEIGVLREDRIELYEVMTEGANLESRRIFKEFKKKYKEMMKEAKTHIKSGEYDKAVKKLEEAKKYTHKTYDKILNEDTTMGSFVFGFLVGNVPFLLRDLGMILLSIPTFGIAGYGNQIAKIVERINVVVKDWQKKETKSVELEDVNFYKNALKVRMNEYDKMIDITIKKVKQAKKSKK